MLRSASALPCRASGQSDVSANAPMSNSAVSRNWLWFGRRATIAAVTAIDDTAAPIRSQTDGPAFSGGLPGLPVVCMIPQSACVTVSNARRPCSGPDSPNPFTEQ